MSSIMNRPTEIIPTQQAIDFKKIVSTQQSFYTIYSHTKNDIDNTIQKLKTRLEDLQKPTNKKLYMTSEEYLKLYDDVNNRLAPMLKTLNDCKDMLKQYSKILLILEKVRVARNNIAIIYKELGELKNAQSNDIDINKKIAALQKSLADNQSNLKDNYSILLGQEMKTTDKLDIIDAYDKLIEMSKHYESRINDFNELLLYATDYLKDDYKYKAQFELYLNNHNLGFSTTFIIKYWEEQDSEIQKKVSDGNKKPESSNPLTSLGTLFTKKKEDEAPREISISLLTKMAKTPLQDSKFITINGLITLASADDLIFQAMIAKDPETFSQLLKTSNLDPKIIKNLIITVDKFLEKRVSQDTARLKDLTINFIDSDNYSLAIQKAEEQIKQIKTSIEQLKQQQNYSENNHKISATMQKIEAIQKIISAVDLQTQFATVEKGIKERWELISSSTWKADKIAAEQAVKKIEILLTDTQIEPQKRVALQQDLARALLKLEDFNNKESDITMLELRKKYLKTQLDDINNNLIKKYPAGTMPYEKQLEEAKKELISLEETKEKLEKPYRTFLEKAENSRMKLIESQKIAPSVKIMKDKLDTLISNRDNYRIIFAKELSLSPSEELTTTHIPIPPVSTTVDTSSQQTSSSQPEIPWKPINKVKWGTLNDSNTEPTSSEPVQRTPRHQTSPQVSTTRPTTDNTPSRPQLRAETTSKWKAGSLKKPDSGSTPNQTPTPGT